MSPLLPQADQNKTPEKKEVVGVDCLRSQTDIGACRPSIEEGKTNTTLSLLNKIRTELVLLR